jgi:predicted 3-demethylubiquinone-9 3-methyltransferase (glyoxalase superfamily)
VPRIGLDGGDVFKHSEAFSFQIATDYQAETDLYWNAIIDNGGIASECGGAKTNGDFHGKPLHVF